MCQHWLSFGGLALDIAGFLIIARAWYRAIHLQVAEKVDQAGEAYGGRKARAEGGGNEFDGEDPKVGVQRWVQRFHLRSNLFWLGAALIFFGVLAQALGNLPLGNLPSGIPTFGIKSC